MSVVIIILEIFGWVLLGLLLLVILLLLIPADVFLAYDSEKFNITLRYLFFRYVLYDSSAEKGKPEPRKPAAENIEAVTEEDSATKTAGTVRLILGLLNPASKAMKRILRSLRFRHVRLVLVAQGADAAQTGIRCGRHWAIVGGAMSLIYNIWPHFTCEQLEVIPDFSGENAGQQKFSCQIRAFLFIILISGLYILRAYLAARKEQILAAEEHQ